MYETCLKDSVSLKPQRLAQSAPFLLPASHITVTVGGGLPPLHCENAGGWWSVKMQVVVVSENAGGGSQ